MSVALDLNIKWDVFHSSEREIVERALEAGHAEQIAAMLQEVTPEKAQEIEKILTQLRPKDYAFESSVQKEFEIWLSQNLNLLTPEIEQEWQRKIDDEKAEMLKRLTGGKIDATAENIDGSTQFGTQISNLLTDVKGLGEASVKKLRDSNINNVEQFRAMPFEEKRKVLGAVVAANFKDFN